MIMGYPARRDHGEPGASDAPAAAPSAVRVLSSDKPDRPRRVASFLLYLTTPDEGGETVFPLEGKGGMKRLHGIDYTSCEVGLKVKPRKGDALLFWSVHPNNTFDRSSLHGGCPVVSGTKFVATKWIHDNSFAI